MGRGDSMRPPRSCTCDLVVRPNRTMVEMQLYDSCVSVCESVESARKPLRRPHDIGVDDGVDNVNL